MNNQNTLNDLNDPGNLTPSAGFPAASAAPALPGSWSEPVAITFTGSGSEYFRIWIVNLLLMLVTLGIYYPWAKARRLRYFHANTHIGAHAFSFHGEGGSMLRGFLLVGLLMIVVGALGEFSPMFGLLLLLPLVAVGPLLLRLSLQFRMTQTRWRGLRFGFDGTLREAVWASAAALAFLFCVLAAPMLEHWSKDQPSSAVAVMTAGVGIVVLCLMPFLPLVHRALLGYRQGHIRYAGQRSSFTATIGSFYMPIVKCALAGMLVGLLALGLSSPWLMAPLVLVSWVVCLAIWHAGIQNAVWSGTRMPQVVLRSRLDTAQLAWRYFLNGLCLVFTLGLYWPFAAVATARLRLSAVSVSFGPDFERSIAEPVQATDNASGDAAADLAGLDLGL